MNIVSVFDGMACGMIAMIVAGINVERYVSYEIDQYAKQTSKHNFPFMEQRGDVFSTDFTEFEGFDFLVGGSPCTYWSIAQTKNRETQASGLGWELFKQYVRALNEIKPKYFIYENNKSMSQAIKESITETFGFEPICINSALVSAQSRQRLYWVGIRRENGTYRKANVEQPEDKGILLKDILENKYTSLSEREMDYMVRDHLEHRWGHCNKPNEEDKSKCVVANISKGVPYNVVAEPFNPTQDGKAGALTASYYKISGVPISEYGSENGRPRVAVRIGTMPNPEGEVKGGQGMRIYSTEGKSVPITTGQTKTGFYAEPIGIKRLGGFYGQATRWEIYDEEGKSPTLTAAMGMGGGHVPMVSENADEKTPQVYEVKNGKIIVKGKEYPIKLADGYYIIRKLTVLECMRLQTVPEWYEFPVSNTQAYKMLGNGWTISVIAHLIKSALADTKETEHIEFGKQIDIYDYLKMLNQ